MRRLLRRTEWDLVRINYVKRVLIWVGRRAVEAVVGEGYGLWRWVGRLMEEKVIMVVWGGERGSICYRRRSGGVRGFLESHVVWDFSYSRFLFESGQREWSPPLRLEDWFRSAMPETDRLEDESSRTRGISICGFSLCWISCWLHLFTSLWSHG